MREKYKLIEISEDNEDSENTIEYYLSKNKEIKDSDNDTNNDDNSDNYIEILIKNEDDNKNNTDPKIQNFINFCIKKRLFDDCFYDYNNIFSAIATKLPDTFDIMSKNGKDIKKERFTSLMRNKYKYKGDLNYIYSLMDEDDKGYITWDEFKDFFLPYIQNVTM